MARIEKMIGRKWKRFTK